MDSTSERQNRLINIYETLKKQGAVTNKRDFAGKVKFDYSGMSSALNGNPRYLTDSLFAKISTAFPQIEAQNPTSNYQQIESKSVKSTLLKKNIIDNESSLPSSAQPSACTDIQELIAIIKQQQALNAKAQDQISRLVDIILSMASKR